MTITITHNVKGKREVLHSCYTYKRELAWQLIQLYQGLGKKDVRATIQ